MPHGQVDRGAWLLLVNAGMDRKDEVMALLQKAYSDHSNAITTLKVEPNYDRLRSDPRFQDLIRLVGLSQ